MRILSKSTLREFWQKYPECKEPLQTWYEEANRAKWMSPIDVKKIYPSASILEDNRVVFNIKGNKYRLIVRINYKYGIMWIRFIGTHGQYDKTDAATI